MQETSPVTCPCQGELFWPRHQMPSALPPLSHRTRREGGGPLQVVRPRGRTCPPRRVGGPRTLGNRPEPAEAAVGGGGQGRVGTPRTTARNASRVHGRARSGVRRFREGGDRLRRSPPRHPRGRRARGRLRRVGEVSPSLDESTSRGSLPGSRSGTPSKSAEDAFSGGVQAVAASPGPGASSAREEITCAVEGRRPRRCTRVGRGDRTLARRAGLPRR